MSSGVVQAIFWLSLGCIAITYAGYPAAIFLLAKLCPRPVRRERWWSAEARPVSIVLAVHNGAARIEAQMDALLALEPELIGEIVVVSDGSIDATNELLRSIAARHGDARLRLLLLDEQVGKATALNHGIAAATGEVLLFVDVRPRVQPGSVARLIEAFADAKVGCVAGELQLLSEGHDGAASAVSGLYWRYEQAIRHAEAAFDSPVGVYGGFYAMRRSLATPLPDGCILDDMFQPLSVIRQGYRSVLEPRAIVTDVWPAKASGEFARKVRTLAGNFQLVAQSPWLLSAENRVLAQLVSHKLLRLVVPYFFVLLLVSSIVPGLRHNAAQHHATVYAAVMLAFAVAQGLFWAMAALSLRAEWIARIPIVGRVASPAGALLVLNAAAVVALYRYLFAPRPLWRSLWTPGGALAASAPE